MPRPSMRTGALRMGAAVLALAAVPGWAACQTMNANSASYNAGYHRTADAENQPVDVQMADANGNMAVVNGLIQNGASGSVFANASSSAQSFASAFSGGVGNSASATAIGNNLIVVTQGDTTVVVVNATQSNTGAVTATATTNGK